MTNTTYYQFRSRADAGVVVMAMKLRPTRGALSAQVYQVTWSNRARRAFGQMLVQGNSDDRGNLPWSEIRAFLEFDIDGIFFMPWDLGLSAHALEEAIPGCILTVDAASVPAKKGLSDVIHSNLSSWCGSSLRLWCEHNKALKPLVVIEQLCAGGGAIEISDQKLDLVTEGGIIANESGLAYRLAKELAGETLFPSLPPVRLVMRTDMRGSSAELMTYPVQVPLNDGSTAAWSAIARVIVQSVPYSKDVLVQILPRKRRWMQSEVGAIWGMRSWSGYLLPTGTSAGHRVRKAMTFRAFWKDSAWRLDPSFAGVALRSGLYTVQTVEQILAMAPTNTGAAWAGMAHNTKFGATPLGRTMTEIDEQQLLIAARERLGAFVCDEPIATRRIAHRDRIAVSTKILGISGLLEAVTGSARTEDWDAAARRILGSDKVKEGATADKNYKPGEVVATREMQARALASHHEEPPLVWILHKGDRGTADLIATELKALFGSALTVEFGEIPAGTHIRPESGAKLNSRFDARVKSWAPFATKMKEFSEGRPTYALICAPKFIDGKAEDAVNCPAAIHALALHANCNAHYVLPIEKKSLRGLASFAHRVQSAASDLLLAHNGHLYELPLYVRKSFGASTIPSAIIGISLIRAGGGRRLGGQHMAIVAATRFGAGSERFEVRFGYRSPTGKNIFTEWMQFRDGLRHIAARGRIDIGNHNAGALLVQDFVDDTITSACRAGQPLVLVDATSMAEFWLWMKDDRLNPDAIALGVKTGMSARWASARIIRLKTQDMPPLRSLMRATYERLSSTLASTGDVEERLYPTTATRIVQISGEEESAPAHYLGINKYSSKTHMVRGRSGYRTMPRFVEAEALPGSKGTLVVLSTSEPMLTEDGAIPSSLGITIAKLLPGDAPDQIASFVLGLRIGYGHTSEWTTLPAPLFFSRKISDYFVHQLLEQMPEGSAEAVPPDGNDGDNLDVDVPGLEDVLDPEMATDKVAAPIRKEDGGAAAAAAAQAERQDLAARAPGTVIPRKMEDTPRIDELLRMAVSKHAIIQTPSFITRASVSRAVGSLQNSDIRLMFEFMAKPDVKYVAKGQRPRNLDGFVTFFKEHLEIVGAAALINHVNDRDSRPRPIGRELHRYFMQKYMPPGSTPREQRAEFSTYLPLAMIELKGWDDYADLMFWAHVLNYQHVAIPMYNLAKVEESSRIAEATLYIDRSYAALQQFRDERRLTRAVGLGSAPLAAASTLGAEPPAQTAPPVPIISQKSDTSVPGAAPTTPQANGMTSELMNVHRQRGHELVDLLTSAGANIPVLCRDVDLWLEEVAAAGDATSSQVRMREESQCALSEWAECLSSPALAEICEYDHGTDKLVRRLRNAVTAADLAQPEDVVGECEALRAARTDVLKCIEAARASDAEIASARSRVNRDRAVAGSHLATERLDAAIEEHTHHLARLGGLLGLTERPMAELPVSEAAEDDAEALGTASPPEVKVTDDPPGAAHSDSVPKDEDEDQDTGAVTDEAESTQPPNIIAESIESNLDAVDADLHRWMADQERRDELVASTMTVLLARRRIGMAKILAGAYNAGMADVPNAAIKAAMGGDLMSQTHNYEEADVAGALQSLASYDKSVSWEQGSAQRATMAAILTGCLRPALYLPTTPARSIVRKLLVGKFGDAGPLHWLVTLLDEDCQRLPDVRPEQLRTYLEGGQGAWDARTATLINRAKQWRNENSDISRGFSYRFARAAWTHLMTATPVSAALDTIGAGDIARMGTKIEQALKFISDDIEQLIDSLTKEVDRRQRPMEASNRERLRSNILETHRFLVEAAAHVAANPALRGSGTGLTRSMEQFATNLRNALHDSSALLETQSAQEAPLHGALMRQAAIVIRGVLTDLEGDTRRPSERSFTDLISDELLLSRLHLYADLRPDPFQDEETVAAICDETAMVASLNVGESWPTTVEAHIDSGRLISADVLLTRHSALPPDKQRADKLRDGYNLKIGTLRTELFDAIEAARQDVALASAMSAVDEGVRREIDAVIDSVSEISEELPVTVSKRDAAEEAATYALPPICDFHSANKHLTMRVRRPLRQKLDKMQESFAQQMIDFEADADEDQKAQIAELRRQVRADDPTFTGLITAHEQLRAIKLRQPDGGGEVANVHLHEYEERFLPAVESVTDILKATIDELSDGRRPDYQLRDMTEGETQGAIEMLRAFQAIVEQGLSHDERREKIRDLFTLHLKTPVGRIVHAGNASNANSFRIEQASLPTATFLPPVFGSKAAGRYGVRVHVGRASGLDSVLGAGQLNDGAGFSLINAQLTRNMRARAASHARSKRNSMTLTIDAYLAVHLALNCNARIEAMLGISLPLLCLSPYEDVHQMAPEMFFGRQTMIQSVTESGVGKIIYGGRRTGKTSILWWLKQRRSSFPNSLYVYVPCRTVAGDDYVNAFCTEVVDQLVDAKVLQRATHKPDIRTLLASIDIWLRTDSERRLMLMLDETDDLVVTDTARDLALITQLTQFAERSNGRFRILLAGLHNVQRLVSTPNSVLGQFGAPISVQPFIDDDRIDGIALVTQPLAALGFEFDQKHLAKHILAVTNYYPAMIQEYCSYLLNYLYRRPGPVALPYKIKSRDLQIVERDRGLVDSLKEKLMRNLTLDPRYNLIAHLIVLSQSTAPSGGGAMTLDELREGCMDFGAQLFADAPASVIETLVDEMVGLAILTQTDRGYLLRSPTIASKLGTQETVLAALDNIGRAAQDGGSLEPGEIRVMLDGKEALPIQRSQFQRIFVNPRGALSIVVGSAAAGLSRLLEVPDHPELPKQGTQIERFRGQDLEALRQMSAQRRELSSRALAAQPLRVIIVPENVMWNTEWLQKLAKNAGVLERLKTRIVFLADIAQAELLADDGNRPSSVRIEHLAPWSEVAIRAYARDVERGHLSITRPMVDGIYSLTGGFGPWIEILVQHAVDDRELLKPAPDTLKLMRTPDDIKSIFKLFGLPQDLLPVLRKLAVNKMRAPALGELMIAEGVRYPPGRLLLLEWFGAVIRNADGSMRLNPLIARFL